MSATGPKNPERSFGLSVGSVLCLIAAVLFWRGRMQRAEIVVGVGAVLLVAGLVYPPVLKWPSAAWWKFSRALGYVNARVILTVLFAIVLVPLSLVWRLTGRDPLARRRDRWPGWSPYPSRYRNPRHYDRMY
jgi:xanthine/uracil permease